MRAGAGTQPLEDWKCNEWVNMKEKIFQLTGFPVISMLFQRFVTYPFPTTFRWSMTIEELVFTGRAWTQGQGERGMWIKRTGREKGSEKSSLHCLQHFPLDMFSFPFLMLGRLSPLCHSPCPNSREKLEWKRYAFLAYQSLPSFNIFFTVRKCLDKEEILQDKGSSYILIIPPILYLS